jgi:hypothetical protein
VGIAIRIFILRAPSGSHLLPHQNAGADLLVSGRHDGGWQGKLRDPRCHIHCNVHDWAPRTPDQLGLHAKALKKILVAHDEGSARAPEHSNRYLRLTLWVDEDEVPIEPAAEVGVAAQRQDSQLLAVAVGRHSYDVYISMCNVRVGLQGVELLHEAHC